MEEINRDLPEADFWPGITSGNSGEIKAFQLRCSLSDNKVREWTQCWHEFSSERGCLRIGAIDLALTE
ncbi:MAG: hypothetical protein DMG77_18605 [Acidobacteria bacterium]|nr:MAG: hypothetical protein DMG77_18605 [Acidobacteriota bacterium]